MQDLALASHAEAFIQEQQMNDAQNGGMRSSRNTESYKNYKENMREKYGGIQ